MDKLFNFTFDNDKVVYHSYRTAKVYNTFFEIDRNSDVGRDMEDTLIEKSGARGRDNHVVFEIVNCRDGATLYVWIHDDMIRVGSEIYLGSY